MERNGSDLRARDTSNTSLRTLCFEHLENIVEQKHTMSLFCLAILMHQQCCELDVSNWSFLSVCSDPKSSCIFCCPFVAIKLSGVRGQMRIFSAAVERLKQCLDPEEEKKRQPFVQQLQEERS